MSIASRQNRKSCVWSVILLVAATMTTGCESDAQTGALLGAGIGALAGQAIGGDTGGTLIGAAAGGGIGYVLGNEGDKKKAKEMEQSRPVSHAPSGSSTTSPNVSHSEVGNLGGSRWMVVSLAPTQSYISMIIEFRDHGRVITTITNADGKLEVIDERYRVVDSTLIINKADYIINASYLIDGDEMIISADNFRAVLKRIV